MNQKFSPLRIHGFSMVNTNLVWDNPRPFEAMLDRIIIGDSRKVLRDIPTEVVHLIHTSPPYNIEKPYAHTSDDLESTEYIKLLSDVFRECYRIMKPGASLFLQTGYSQDGSDEISPIDMLSYSSMQHLGFRLWDRIIWFYQGGISFSRKFKNAHETILWWVKPYTDKSFQPYFDVDSVREKSVSYDKRNNLYGRNPGNVWSEDRVAFGGHARDTSHIAIYPESVTERIIRSCSREGELVLDPFAGSGTTPSMARALGRKWIGVEISPKYAAEALSRIGRRQASEMASLGSGLLKILVFTNKPGIKPYEYLVKRMEIWFKSFDLSRFTNLKNAQLGDKYESDLFETYLDKKNKPHVWRFFDSFLNSQDDEDEPFLLIIRTLDYYYPQRRRWNSVRKFLHSLATVQKLIRATDKGIENLILNIVANEPSSFNLFNDHVEFSGPSIQLARHSLRIEKDGDSDIQGINTKGSSTLGFE